MGLTAVQVHDYFYNKWQLQFFDSPNLYKKEFKQTYLEHLNPNLSAGENIKIACAVLKKKHPEKNFCERQLYQIIYHIASQRNQYKKKQMIRDSTQNHIILFHKNAEADDMNNFILVEK